MPASASQEALKWIVRRYLVVVYVSEHIQEGQRLVPAIWRCSFEAESQLVKNQLHNLNPTFNIQVSVVIPKRSTFH